MSDRLTFTLKRVYDDAGWQEVLSGWREFAHRQDVTGGFWCQPDVLYAFESTAGLGELLLVTAMRDDQPVAFIPFRLEKKPVPIFIGLWRAGRMRAVTARLFDYDFPVTTETDRLQALMDVAAHLGENVGCDVVLGQNCVASLRDSEARRGCVAWRNIQASYLADLPDSLDGFLQQLSSKSRQTLKRKVRKAERECEGLQLLCYTSPTAMETLLVHLQEVWSKSWHGRLGRQRPPGKDVLQRLSERGLVRGYVLTNADAVPMATVLGYTWNGVYHDEAPAYDEQWSHLSPGLILNYCIIKDLIENNAATQIDFGFGYNQYKQVLGNRRIERGNLWIPLSARGRRIVRILRVSDCGYRTGKRILGWCGIDRWVKHRMQGRGRSRQK